MIKTYTGDCVRADNTAIMTGWDKAYKPETPRSTISVILVGESGTLKARTTLCCLLHGLVASTASDVSYVGFGWEAWNLLASSQGWRPYKFDDQISPGTSRGCGWRVGSHAGTQSSGSTQAPDKEDVRCCAAVLRWSMSFLLVYAMFFKVGGFLSFSQISVIEIISFTFFSKFHAFFFFTKISDKRKLGKAERALGRMDGSCQAEAVIRGHPEEHLHFLGRECWGFISFVCDEAATSTSQQEFHKK